MERPCRGPKPIVVSLLVAAALVSAGRPARGAVCAATEICPAGNSSCTISATFDVRAGCILDFAPRPVTITGTLRAELPGQSFTLRAPSLTLDGGSLLAPGASGGNGGAIDVEVAGPFQMLGSSPQVSVDTNGIMGEIAITAGSIDMRTGIVSANGSDGGSTIELEATDAFVAAGTIRSLGVGPSDATGGGIEITGGSVELRSRVDVSGRAGGGGDVTVTATSGTILVAGTAQITANAENSKDGAGDGGGVALTAAGAVSVDGKIQADGPGPDGSAGDIEIESEAADVHVGGGANLLVRGLGKESDGGTMTLAAATRLDVDANALLDASAGAGDSDWTPFGGSIELGVSGAPGSVTIAAGAELRARNDGSVVTESPGTLLVAGTIDATGGSASYGGAIALGPHCAIDLQGTVDSSGPIALGSPRNHLVGRAITISGHLVALPCDLEAPSSCNVLTVKTRTASNPGTAGAVISPPPSILENPLLNACCGNGVADGAPEQCDDGNGLFCDACSPTCTIVDPDICASDGDPCTGPGCDPRTGCLPATGPACATDGDPCTDDVCKSGQCTHDSPCDPDNLPPCKTGMCEVGVGCVFEDRPDGTSCPGAVCSASVCQAGECVAVGPLDCDDSDPCTADRCDTAYGGCVNVEIPGACPCIVDGVPLPQNTPCVDGDNCTTADRCDGAGNCVPGPGCADGDPCTTDVCTSPEDFGCFHVEFGMCPWSCEGRLDGTFCADRDGCTVGTCHGGACTSEPIVCAEPDETCHPLIQEGSSAGCRFTPSTTTCPDDSNPCTSERIDPLGGCLHEPLSGTAAPDDGDQCTQDVCQNGTATHPPRRCDDGLACTADSCDPATGCLFAPDDGRCDDGDACTADRCVAGTGCTHTGSCGLDDFACYQTARVPGAPVAGVWLADALFTATVKVRGMDRVCAPARDGEWDATGALDAAHLATHVTARASHASFVPRRGARVTNRLGTITVDVLKPERLAAPSATSLTAPPPLPTSPPPDHFQCYKAANARGAARFLPIRDVPLADQFETVAVDVMKPVRLCLPVDVNDEDPGAPAHPGVLFCYQVKTAKGSPRLAPVSPLFATDRFGEHTTRVTKLKELCLASSLEMP